MIISIILFTGTVFKLEAYLVQLLVFTGTVFKLEEYLE